MKFDEDVLKELPVLISGVLIIIILFGGLLFFSSCTISINNVRTSGEADDVIDENQKADADPNVTIPAKLI